MIDRAIFHRAPLAPDAFAPLPTGAIKPLGYLLAAERAQANGLGGQITRVWDGLRDSAWMGGKGENWERGPYYLDGLIPLAWQLEDEELQNLARRFVGWILASQDEEGFFGPKDNPDWWPRMVVLKALQQYFTITGDKKILVFLTKYFAYMARKLDEQPLGLWAIARAGDCVDAILWLYDITGKAGLLKLCDKVLGQAMDWTRHFHTFPDEQDQKRAHPWSMLEPRLKATQDPWSEAWQIHQRTHVVNLAMALKTPQVEHALHGGTKQADAFRAGWEKLTRFHGVANGMFTGDEHLSGANPSQGTETCAVVETLYSLERVLALTGGARVGDLWERIAYNALPAALSPDGWAHQYDQQVNQIRIDRYPRAWYNNKPDANVFGLEPNYGCCTANLHQGYPKFTAHLWMAVRGGGLAAQSYAPCEVLWRAGQTRIRLTVGGDYPTQERVRIRLKMEGEARFPILLRIPGWAEGAHAEVAGERLEGTPGQYLRLERVWGDGDEIELTLPMQVRTEKWHHQTLAVYRGPVLFALPVPAKWEYKGEMPLCDRWAEPQGPWNYALVPEEGFAVEGGGARIACSAVRCPGWVEKGGSADDPPVRPLRGDAPVERISLVPYAQAPLRVAQFPWARNG